jgi:hypothetical protein
MVVFSLLAGTGFVALALAVLMGFEEANGAMLFVSTLLLVAAPAVVLGRVAFSHDLTRDEKRAWLRAMTGRRALHAWSSYLRLRTHQGSRPPSAETPGSGPRA